MNVLYFHDRDGNFGDDLNRMLWPRLLPRVSFAWYSTRELRERRPEGLTVIGGGTILNAELPPAIPKIILGAGAGYGQPPVIDKSYQILAVRGPHSAARLGLPEATAVTDFACLLRAVDSTGAPNRSGVGFMPHHKSMPWLNWARICDRAGVVLIDPRRSVDQVLASIRRRTTLITESLHGAIVADLYRIPWVPARLSYLLLDFKWNDWCASMRLAYRPSIGPRLLSITSRKGRLNNIAREPMVIRFLRTAQQARPTLSNESLLRARTDQMIDRVDQLRDRVRAGG